MFQEVPLPRVQDLVVKPLAAFQPGSLVYLRPALSDEDDRSEGEELRELPMQAAAAICCSVEINQKLGAGVYLLDKTPEGSPAQFLHAEVYPELFARLTAGLERVPVVGFGPGGGMRIPKLGTHRPGRGTIGFTESGPLILSEAPGGLSGMLDPIRWHIVTTGLAWPALAAEARLFEAKWLTEDGAILKFRIHGR